MRTYLNYCVLRTSIAAFFQIIIPFSLCTYYLRWMSYLISFVWDQSTSPAISASKATEYKKEKLCPLSFEATTLRFLAWCFTHRANRALIIFLDILWKLLRLPLNIHALRYTNLKVVGSNPTVRKNFSFFILSHSTRSLQVGWSHINAWHSSEVIGA